jgi:hypothetical protein
MKTLSRLLGAALLFAMGADPSLAAIFTVNSGYDSVDVTPGDSICSDASGFCSLRAAVMQANFTPTAADTIVLNVPLVTLSIPWSPFSIDDDSSGDLDILGPVTIEGEGATVEWSSAVPTQARDRVFHFFPVYGPFDAQLKALTVRGGVATPVEVKPLQFWSIGGGVLIQNSAAVRVAVQLDNVTVVENRAFDQGGGVWSQGNLDMQDSTISANRVERGCDPVAGDVFGGGGLYNQGLAHVVRSTFSGNLALNEGADGGGCGGGILNHDGVLTMVNSTVSSNYAFLAGGGLWNLGQARLSFVTNSLNVAYFGAGGGLNNQSVMQMTASILAFNAPLDCASAPGITNGFNLDSDSSCDLTGPGDLPGVDPVLGALQINPPGLTKTHALGVGSPALDVVAPPCLDVFGDPVLEDQLGNPRPSPYGAARCDIGAVEGISDLLFRDGFEGVASRMRR